MGIDVYTYVRQTTPDGDTLVSLDEWPGVEKIDWREVLGHPITMGWTEELWEPGKKIGWIDLGYIRESYHGHAHPINVLAPESFKREDYENFGKPDEDGYYEHSGCHIPIDTLKARLPETLEVARLRFSQYGEDPAKADEWWGYQQYIDLVKVHEYLARGDLQAYLYNSY